jgi:uncharacterized protein
MCRWRRRERDGAGRRRLTTMTTATTAPAELDRKLERLNEILGTMGSVLIGYSGGVDSALLALAAHKVLGENAIAVTADSESYASGELEAASRIAGNFGMRHLVVHTRELDNPDYARNPTNRCYFCKHELFTHLNRMAGELGVTHLAYGQNLDDVGDFRPGAVAADEYQVRAPLREAGLSKADVRALAKRWELEVWNRPAMACLSSRFPYGTPITAESLRVVDRAEAALRNLGFVELRVRHHDAIARIELDVEALEALLTDHRMRAEVVAALCAAGYARVTADLRGFRSGSMNETLLSIAGESDPEEQQWRRAVAEFGVEASFEPRDRMLVLAIPEAQFATLAGQRSAIAEKLGSFGFNFIAVELAGRP